MSRFEAPARRRRFFSTSDRLELPGSDPIRSVSARTARDARPVAIDSAAASMPMQANESDSLDASGTTRVLEHHRGRGRAAAPRAGSRKRLPMRERCVSVTHASDWKTESNEGRPAADERADRSLVRRLARASATVTPSSP
ncbi:hypothetical protein [Burkholderia sp. MSMB617WGS]|uniref:hypothetical protein n=1 Tax=Burkholderia sp. MSMB617WGS TaxID=1637831 RepID=UPI000AE62481|nr:hypothetical protein [Burkholderia sp. MSMB617WGS]